MFNKVSLEVISLIDAQILLTTLLNKIDKSYTDKEVILGIRPKATSVVMESNIKAKVSISEQLGDEALIYFKIDNFDKELVSSIQSYDVFKPNQEICLNFDLEHASVFSKDTEESILK